MRKPPNVVYNVDEVPPPGIQFFSGLQHVGMMAIYLVFVDPDAVHDTMDRLLPPRRPVSGAPADP